ncbi:DUF1206 domain-containing protein [Nocardioides panacisoli]|uniref:DUF1206 domain-containing protein n=1 Tax=Nocardioides panacisoli TaxID=627624 RepID=A0ABP7IPR1_9ACTN
MTTSDARDATESPALRWPARLGMVGYGVVYLLIAWLAVQLAFGDSAGQASGSGALHELAQQPFGGVLLVLVAVGLAGFCVWEACRAVAGHRSDDGARRWVARAGSAGRALVYATLAVLAVLTAFGDSSSGGGSQGTTASLLKLPLGPAIVVAVGLGIAAVGLVGGYRGISDRWRKDVEVEGQQGKVGGVVEVLARAGYLSRGLAFLAVAGFFVWAGVADDARKSGGLDQAIVKLRDEPYGPWLILVVAIGLACFGGFQASRAWFLRRD